MDDSVITRKKVEYTGMGVASPPNSLISKVCRRSCSRPTSMNKAPVETPCARLMYIPPTSPAWVKLKKPSTTKPRWETEE